MSDDGYDEDFEGDEDGLEDEDLDGEEVEEIGKDGVKRKKTRGEMTKRERLILKKRRLKEKFNQDFDEKMKDKNGVSHDHHFEHLSHIANKQAELNRLEFEKMDDSTRIEYEGFKCGTYFFPLTLRWVICESKVVENFLIKVPLALGDNFS